MSEIDVALSTTKEELETTNKILKRIAFEAGYGHDPKLCRAVNKVISHIGKLEMEIDVEQIERSYCLGCGKEIMTESGQICNQCKIS